MRLDHRLPLFSFLLGELGFEDFDSLSAPMSDPRLEEPSLDEVSRFFHELVGVMPSTAPIDPHVLRRYDETIRTHTERVSRHRPGPIRWRYFQYLILLFTEHFLERLFADQDLLLHDLNTHLERFNRELPDSDARIPEYERSDLRKLALWSATGSGKTLVMHVNLLQVLSHYERSGRRSDLNRVLLLTPNEGLSRQHREEFELSGIEAEIFAKDAGSLFRGRQVEIIDIHKLRDVEGEKSVAIEAFGDDNLVMVDEGHKGAGGEHWMRARERLCRNGFSFEYSATFGQAFAGRQELERSYAKWIVFDYAYRRFHADGYGKDFRILNFPGDDDTSERRTYLCGALLSFYQQQRYFADLGESLRPYQLEPPLWAFVGSNVNARVVRTVQGRRVSDVVEILLAFAWLLKEPEAAQRAIESLLAGGGGLLDADGANIFAGTFPYLEELGLDGEAAYRDILARFFNCASPGPLRVVRPRGVSGELVLQVGDNPPFGVVNVGDAPALHKLCGEQDEMLATDEITAGHSLFDTVNAPGSPVNLVVGAKKFIEGWSSWRVSSLGLMRMGRNEGPQIIQLFGRGVRLKGHDFSLKRSSRLQPPPAGLPAHIGLLETLTVFGLRADYMATFKDQLEIEGVAPRRRLVAVPVVVPDSWPAGLRLIRPQPGSDFVRQAERISLLPGDGEDFGRAVVNWYSRVAVLASEDADRRAGEEVLNEVDLTPSQLAFFDLEEASQKLARHKAERGWHNLVIAEEDVAALLERHDWYRLFVPPELVAIESIEDVQRWRQIATALLRGWCERRVKDAAQAWLQPRLRYVELTPDDPNVVDEHLVSIPADDREAQEVFEHIAGDLVHSGQEFASFGAGGAIQMLNFEQHLYRPLLYVHKDESAVLTPTPLNDGEARFLKDVNAWCNEGPPLLAGRRLFVLRNQARNRGVGFFEAGNFYPDFIVWLLDEQVQRIAFVDPKGLVRIGGVDDRKIALRRTIKEVERRLGDRSIRLSSFIVSVTPFAKVPWWSGSKGELEDHHVLFQQDDPRTYVGKMVARMLADTENPAAVAA